MLETLMVIIMIFLITILRKLKIDEVCIRGREIRKTVNCSQAVGASAEISWSTMMPHKRMVNNTTREEKEGKLPR